MSLFNILPPLEYPRFQGFSSCRPPEAREDDERPWGRRWVVPWNMNRINPNLEPRIFPVGGNRA